MSATTLAPVVADDDLVIGDRPDSPPGARKQVLRVENFSETSLATYQSQLEYQLMERIDAIDSKYQLTVEQIRKLQLAGRVEIRHIIEDRTRPTGIAYQAPNLKQVNISPRNIGEPQLRDLASPFGHGSMLAKVLLKTLTVEQLDRYESLDRANKLAQIEATLVKCYPASRRLDEDQQQSMAVLIQVKYPSWRPEESGPLQLDVIVMILSELRTDVEPLLNDEQRRWTQSLILAAAKVEPSLREQGVWPLPVPKVR